MYQLFSLIRYVLEFYHFSCNGSAKVSRGNGLFTRRKGAELKGDYKNLAPFFKKNTC